MKKAFLFLVTAFLAMAVTSCSNEIEDIPDLEVATIQMSIRSDDGFLTRATQTADNTAWFAKVGEAEQCNVSELIGKTYTPGEYTITVSSHTDMAAAMPENEAGSAYYETSANITLNKGVNNVSIDCGKAQNSRLSVNWDGTQGVEGFAMTGVEAMQQADGRSFNFTTSGTKAYFYAGSDIECNIKYTHNGAEKTISKTFTAPAAATEYKLIVTANNNGTIITISITYDDEFADGGSTSTEIDAATGEEV